MDKRTMREFDELCLTPAYSRRNCLSFENTNATNPARIRKGGAPKIRMPKSRT